jgi:hypothetical protein
MSRAERLAKQHKPYYKMWSLYILAGFIVLILSLYFYSKTLIRIEAPKQILGEKVIITLPAGKKVYTYENLIIEEEGKLLYKGERNTLNLTGGQIVYENWE